VKLVAVDCVQPQVQAEMDALEDRAKMLSLSMV
jgi:hypothetical protein